MARDKVVFICSEGYEDYVGAIRTALADHGHSSMVLIPSDATEHIDLLRSSRVVATVHSVLREIGTIGRALAGTTPTLTLQDGIIEHCHSNHSFNGIRRYQPLLTDRIAVFGSRSAHLVAAYGSRSESAFITGCPRIMWNEGELERRPSQALLITAANRPAYGAKELVAFYTLFDKVVEFCRVHAIPHIVRLSRGLRFGGVAAVERVADIVGEPLVERFRAQEVSRSSLDDDLRAASAVVTTPSTVSLQAMAKGIPVAHLLFDDQTTYLNPAWNIRPGSDLGRIIDELMRPPELKMRYQNVLLRENLEPGDSVSRVVELICTMGDLA